MQLGSIVVHATQVPFCSSNPFWQAMQVVPRQVSQLGREHGMHWLRSGDGWKPGVHCLQTMYGPLLTHSSQWGITSPHLTCPAAGDGTASQAQQQLVATMNVRTHFLRIGSALLKSGERSCPLML